MKKKTRNFIALLALLALCIGLYFGIKAYNSYTEEKEAEEEAAAVITVTALSDIEQLSWSNGTDGLSFVKDSGVWTYEDTAFPLDASYPEAVEETLSSLTAVRSLEEPEDSLSAYGLEEPAYTVTAVAAGQTVTLLIGNTTNDQYYAQVEGQNTVYTIDSTLVDEISHNLLDMAEIEEFPDLSEENISAITLSLGDETWNLSKNTVVTEAESEETADTDDDTGTDGSESETVTTYHWSGIGGSELSSENDTLSALLDTLGSLQFDACYNYNVDDSIRAACGLTSPTLSLTVSYEDEDGTNQTMSLMVGGSGEDGSYYAVKDNSTTIYTLSSDTVNTLTGLFTAAEG